MESFSNFRPCERCGNSLPFGGRKLPLGLTSQTLPGCGEAGGPVHLPGRASVPSRVQENRHRAPRLTGPPWSHTGRPAGTRSVSYRMLPARHSVGTRVTCCADWLSGDADVRDARPAARMRGAAGAAGRRGRGREFTRAASENMPFALPGLRVDTEVAVSARGLACCAGRGGRRKRAPALPPCCGSSSSFSRGAPTAGAQGAGGRASEPGIPEAPACPSGYAPRLVGLTSCLS